MEKDIMKSNINLDQNIDQTDRYVTPYDNIFDNAVSITKFDISLNSYLEQMKTGKFEYNINEHESNIQKMNKLMLHLQKKHPFYQNNNFFIKNKQYAKNEWE